MKLIDKDALVAEIERRIEDCAKQRKDMLDVQCHTLADDASARMGELRWFQDFLDTIEVKEGEESTAADRGMAEEIIINLKRVEQDYHIDLTKEMEWIRNKSRKGE